MCPTALVERVSGDPGTLSKPVSPLGKNALLIINDLYFAPGTPISLNSSQLKDDGR